MKNESSSEEEASAETALTGESRHEILSRFVSDVLGGRVALSIDQQKWRPEDLDLIGSTSQKLIVQLNEYLSGTVAGEELEFLEKQIVFCMTVLRTYGALKTRLNEPKLEEEIATLEAKVNSNTKMLEEVLALLRTPKAEETATKPRKARRKKSTAQVG